MLFSKKRKQQLSHITALSLESHKHQKINGKNQLRKRILRKQKEKQNCWKEYKDPALVESSFDKSSCDEFAFQESSSEEETPVENNICENLKKNEGRVQLKIEK